MTTFYTLRKWIFLVMFLEIHFWLFYSKINLTNKIEEIKSESVDTHKNKSHLFDESSFHYAINDQKACFSFCFEFIIWMILFENPKRNFQIFLIYLKDNNLI